jgi:hypothetical protein
VYAGVAKLADAYALGAYGVILGGSSPLPGTNMSDFHQELITQLSQLKNVAIKEGASHTTFLVGKKVFGYTKKDDLVLKLPAPTAKKLVNSKNATFLTMGKRTMSEWVVIEHPKSSQFNSLKPLLEESIEYTG